MFGAFFLIIFCGLVIFLYCIKVVCLFDFGV